MTQDSPKHPSLREPAHFWGPAHVVCGPGSIGKLDTIASEINARRFLIVADRHVMAVAVLQEVIESMRSRFQVELVEHDGSEPAMAHVDALRAQTDGAADALIAVGGGSTIDVAKAVALAVAAGGEPLERFEGATPLAFEPLPLIAVPTTAGTGSEVTGSCVLADYRSGRKISIRSPKLLPRAAVLDPQFLASVPPQVIRATGVDALTHALEAYHSTRANVITDRLALGAIALIAGSITRYYRDPSDIDAAASMQVGACMAGMAFNSARVGLAHAIASAIGPLTGFSHGLSVGLGLPAAMRINLSTRAADRRALLFHIGRSDVRDDGWQDAVLAWLAEIYRALDFPTTARAAGAAFDIDDALVDNIVESGRLDTNPVRLSAGELRGVLESIRG